MKKIINLALITILTLSALKTQARTFSSDEVKNEITQQVIESYKKYTDADLKATVLAVPFKDMALPDGKVRFEVTSNVDKFMARDLKKVNIYVNDKFVRTFNAPVDVKAYKDVLVAADFIAREKSLTRSMVQIKRMEVSYNLEYALTENMLGKDIITKKTFKEGEIIDKRFVKLRPDVQRNSEITAFFKRDNILISVDAIALSDGMTGDYIGVENKSYKKIYTGKIIGENKVLIEM
ncbi:MAG TPA: flagellar basal body P-ring formation chaperone FlgA [Candidatus Gastranaerophilaceae bacterium]|nr:flagellar basal body P-ring formation chaperone FlgA [Candidatus Gastranaerophilaceae bacterium]HPT40880.1 flagellar basal body P-ring formation chaperone FlgA [Candidatus Gastranaerophilaceae bacterium]